ncbi:MAG: four helix bundle protein [Candidatus Buchananbacteria bacterium]
MTKFSNAYDLEERTGKFGEGVIALCKTIKITIFNKSIISQIIRSATSVGANYMEANGASSKKDFRNKIYISKKELQETKHWLRMPAECNPEKRSEIVKLWAECHQLTLIFQKITQSLKIKN